MKKSKIQLGYVLLGLVALLFPVLANWFQVQYRAAGTPPPVNPYRRYCQMTDWCEMVARGEDQGAAKLFRALDKLQEVELKNSWLAFHGPRSKYWPFVLDYVALMQRAQRPDLAQMQFRRAANLALNAGEWPQFRRTVAARFGVNLPAKGEIR